MPDEAMDAEIGQNLHLVIEGLRAEGVTYAAAVDEFRWGWMLAELNHTQGNQCAAARGMGVHRNTIYRGVRQAEIQINVKRPGRRRSHLARMLAFRKEENNAKT